eukprot:1298706-Pyramimonas_sp.AAC.1
MPDRRIWGHFGAILSRLRLFFDPRPPSSRLRERGQEERYPPPEQEEGCLTILAKDPTICS